MELREAGRPAVHRVVLDTTWAESLDALGGKKLEVPCLPRLFLALFPSFRHLWTLQLSLQTDPGPPQDTSSFFI
jgi:hypothetical protein